MGAQNREDSIARDLRKRAEALSFELQGRGTTFDGDSKRLVHELQVHQIELEMQNEELRASQLELENSRDRYYDLYDLAPIGYVTLDDRGVIREINLMGAELLGAERGVLLGMSFLGFVVPEDQGLFHSHRHLTTEGPGRQSCQVKVMRRDGSHLHVQLWSSPVHGAEMMPGYIQTAIVDVTERTHAEWKLRETYDQLEKRVEERTAELARSCRSQEREISERKLAECALEESETELRRLSMQLLEAQEEERRRIALELHDGIGQSLSAIKFRVEGTLAAMRDRCMSCEQAADALEPTIAMVQGAVDEIRRISMNLRPPILDDLGIVPTIRWFCRDFQSTYSDIRIWKRIDIDEIDVSKRLKPVVFRLLQEALNNIAKHSGADFVSISLVEKERMMELKIKDNGKGFESNVAGPGIGFRSMRERTEHSGGVFSVESSVEEGTLIRAAWPL